MKYKKILIATILLLAILTVGAVSASEDADVLAQGSDATLGQENLIDNDLGNAADEDNLSPSDYLSYQIGYDEDGGNIILEDGEDENATMLTADDVTATYNGGKNVVATLKEMGGNVIVGAEINVVLDNVNTTLTTDSKGQVSLTTDGLVPGEYTAEFTFAGDDIYKESSVNPKVTISKADIKVTAKYDANSKNIIATVKDLNGKAVSGTKVGFAIDGVKYLYTDENGQAKYSTKGLDEKTYSAKITAYGNSLYKTSNSTTVKFTISKIATKLTVKDVTAPYKSGKDIVATLTDAKGNAINGTKVGFVNNGVNYVLTDSKGQARYSTNNFEEGTYSVIVSFSGDDTYKASEKVTIKVKITKIATKLTVLNVNAKYGEKKYILATLTDAKGNPISGAKIGFTDNGVKYVVTDANGKARYSTSNFKVGTHKVNVAYFGNDTYKASEKAVSTVVINKLTAKLTSQDIKITFRDVGYLLASLKDADNKPMKGVKILFTANGKKVITTTDVLGIAKLPTKDFAPDIYDVSIKFAGTSIYEEIINTAKMIILKRFI